MTAAIASPTDNLCKLPETLQTEVSSMYPGSELVTLAALDADDKAFYLQDHKQSCPGLVEVDFFGDHKPTIAMVLITSGKDSKEAKLLVAHNVSGNWKISLVDSTHEAGVPVLWSQPPGSYTDVYGKKQLLATAPVIVFTRFESWSILYAWTGKRISTIWLQD